MKNTTEKKPILGRGLSALLNSSTLNSSEGKHLEYLEVSKIISNKNQPRKLFCDEKLQELALSIQKIGVIEPIIVKKINQNNEFLFEIIAGERRWKACKIAEIKTIPAIIESEDQQYELEISLIENIQRENLNPIEEATSYKKILEKRLITHESLSKLVGKSRSHISNIIRLVSLPEIIQQKVITGEISYGKARTLLSFSPTEQMEVFEKLCAEKDISVRDLENFSKKNRKKIVSRETIFQNSKIEEDIVTVLRIFFQCKIKIRKLEKHSAGKIEISFQSDEDLLFILEKVKESMDSSNTTETTTMGDFFVT